MAEVREYKKRDFVLAERVEKTRRIGVGNGLVNAKAGDYLVYENGSTRVVKASDFEREFIVVESAESEAREFTPAGKTVEIVVEFLRENPDEIDRVKALERAGAERRGILEYEKR